MPSRIEQHKAWFWVILNVVLVLVGLFVIVSGKAIWRQSAAMAPARTIAVMAEGRATLAPDIATFNFSVVSQGADPVKLQTDNNTKVNDAIDFVKSQGIDAKDIKTSEYNLSPNYVWNQKTGRSTIDGYTLNQSVTVKVRDLEKVSAILGGLPSKGINQISGVNFSVEDQDKYLNEAREEAFTKARAKAQAMAKYSGARIGRVVTFSENGGGYPYPMYYAKELSVGMGGDAQMPPAPNIQPGSQEVTVTVNVVYELR